MGDFDNAKQQDVIYDLRGVHFPGCTTEQTDDHTYPIAGVLSSEAATWRDIGNHAHLVAEDLQAGDLAGRRRRFRCRWCGRRLAGRRHRRRHRW